MTDLEAAAPAPAPEDDDPDAGLREIYRKLNDEAEESPVEADEAPKAAEVAEKPVEAPAPVSDAPADLPAAIKAKWGELPPETREAVASSHREMGRKLADQGRLVQGLKPIQDVLTQAIREIPTMRDMKPADVARDVFQMAKISGELKRDPVKTLIGIAQGAGALDGLRQALSGQPPAPAAQQNVQLVNEIAALKKKLAEIADPASFERQVSQTLANRETSSFVTSFAAEKQENWTTVEPYIPAMIPLAKQRLGQSASPKDVLSEAYDMAIHAHPELRAKIAAAAVAPAHADPGKTAAQMKAKSVNVTSRPSAPQTMTEDQQMRAIWRKNHT